MFILVSDGHLSSQHNICCIDADSAHLCCKQHFITNMWTAVIIHIHPIQLLRWWVGLCIIKRHWEQVKPVIARLTVNEALVVRKLNRCCEKHVHQVALWSRQELRIIPLLNLRRHSRNRYCHLLTPFRERSWPCVQSSSSHQLVLYAAFRSS